MFCYLPVIYLLSTCYLPEYLHGVFLLSTSYLPVIYLLSTVDYPLNITVFRGFFVTQQEKKKPWNFNVPRSFLWWRRRDSNSLPLDCQSNCQPQKSFFTKLALRLISQRLREIWDFCIFYKKACFVIYLLSSVSGSGWFWMMRDDVLAYFTSGASNVSV